MIVDLLDAIRNLIYDVGRIPPSEVDVQFDAPTREWIGRLTRPTINLFLFDVRENSDLRQANAQTTRVNGHAERRLPPRRIDLRHMVSAHTTDVGDEHRLLWRALAALMRFPELPPDILPDGVRALGVPVKVRVAQEDDGARILDLWSALGADPHPAFSYVVTAPLDLEVAITAPLVLTRTIRYQGGWDDAGLELGNVIGGIVRDPDGNPLAAVAVRLEASAAEPAVTDSEGRFRLRVPASGQVRLRLTRADGSETSGTLEIPAASYDLTFA